MTTSFVLETLQGKYFKFVEKMVSRNNADMDLREFSLIKVELILNFSSIIIPRAVLSLIGRITCYLALFRCKEIFLRGNVHQLRNAKGGGCILMGEGSLENRF